VSVLFSLVAFAGGAWLLVESVERLVKALTGWAAAAGLSGLALSALVLGFDVESTGAGDADGHEEHGRPDRGPERGAGQTVERGGDPGPGRLDVRSRGRAPTARAPRARRRPPIRSAP